LKRNDKKLQLTGRGGPGGVTSAGLPAASSFEIQWQHFEAPKLAVDAPGEACIRLKLGLRKWNP
jgi:hypothetical protein